MLSIHRRAALPLCCALAWALCCAPARADAEEVRSLSLRGLHVAADGAVTLYISFRSGRDSAVGSVEPAKLRVERGGSVLPGALKVRAPGASDLALLLAVDISGTMRKVMPEIQRGLRPLGGLMKRTGARVAVGAIGESWRVTRDFTAEASEVRKAVKALQASAATTALFESIHLGIGQLHQRGADLPPRRLMIVVSDAFNEKKGRTADECVAAARKALVQVHSLIYLTRRTAETLSRKGELEKISRDSGGSTVTVSGARELRRGLRALVDDLLLERVITIPAERLVHDGREHTLTLRYDRVSASVTYQAPLIAGASATGTAPRPTGAPDAAPAGGDPAVSKKAVSKKAVSKKAVSKKAGPSAEPAASAEEHGALETSTLLQRLQDPRVLGAGGGGLLLIIIAVILLVVLRRRAKRLVTDEPADEPADKPADEPADEPAPEASEPAPEASEPAPEASEPAQVIVAPPVGPAPAPETHARPTLRVDAPSAERARAASAAPSGPELGGLAPAAGPITQLRDVHGLVASTPFKLTSAGARIGSGLSNEIVLDSPTVSDRHAEIVATPTGFAVRDCGSTQGTFLGDVRVGSQPLPIRPGSRIKVGLVTLVCEG